MSEGDVSASRGSISVGGDANAPVINAPNAHQVNLNFEQKVDRELPSFLGQLIVIFSQQTLSEYAKGDRRPLPAEFTDKIKYNELSENHRAIVDYVRHSLVLEQAYLGVEQTNADARYLVRRKAGTAYDAVVQNKRFNMSRNHARVDSGTALIASSYFSSRYMSKLSMSELGRMNPFNCTII